MAEHTLTVWGTTGALVARGDCNTAELALTLLLAGCGVQVDGRETIAYHGPGYDVATYRDTGERVDTGEIPGSW